MLLIPSIANSKLFHRLFFVHSPAKLVYDGCKICGIPSRTDLFIRIEEAYDDGFRAGQLRVRVLDALTKKKGTEETFNG